MLEYTLDEPEAGMGIRLTTTEPFFPTFFFSSSEVSDKTFLITKEAFYCLTPRGITYSSQLGTDTEKTRAYRKAYAAAINHANSLGLKVNNTLDPKRLEYLTESS